MNNEPAFPVPSELCQDLTIEQQRGMTLRDYFAAKTLQGLLASGLEQSRYEFSRKSYEMADEMLRAREA
jgi:hypothetical protein